MMIESDLYKTFKNTLIVVSGYSVSKHIIIYISQGELKLYPSFTTTKKALEPELAEAAGLVQEIMEAEGNIILHPA